MYLYCKFIFNHHDWPVTNCFFTTGPFMQLKLMNGLGHGEKCSRRHGSCEPREIVSVLNESWISNCKNFLLKNECLSCHTLILWFLFQRWFFFERKRNTAVDKEDILGVKFNAYFKIHNQEFPSSNWINIKIKKRSLSKKWLTLVSIAPLLLFSISLSFDNKN